MAAQLSLSVKIGASLVQVFRAKMTQNAQKMANTTQVEVCS
ncbi:MAG: hypothetical protein QM680_10100 [Luteolibacter sp.]